MDNFIGDKNNFGSVRQVWEKMYASSEEWQQDIDFLRDEFSFFHNLIGGYMVWLGKEDSMPQIQTLVKRLNMLQDLRVEVNKKLKRQMVNLEELLNQSFEGNQQQVEEENLALKKLLKDYTRDVRAFKKDIHTVTKIVANSENLKQSKKT